MLRLGDVARMLGVNFLTVKGWVRNQKLRAINIPGTRFWRIPESELAKFVSPATLKALKGGRTFRLSEVARMLNLSVPTLRRWVTEGKVAGYRIGQKVWRIPESEVRRILGDDALYQRLLQRIRK